jgi:hypothetical protein
VLEQRRLAGPWRADQVERHDLVVYESIAQGVREAIVLAEQVCLERDPPRVMHVWMWMWMRMLVVIAAAGSTH